MTGFSSQDATTPGDRAEVVTTDEDTGVYQAVESIAGKGRALQDTVLRDPETLGFGAISPSGALEIGELIRLVGGNFESGALQSNIWDIDEVNGGTATSVTGEAVLSTNTTADGAASIQSVRRARFITATFNKAHHAIQMENPTNTDVIRRWGMYDPINNFASGDGVFWENDSGTYTLKRRKAGSIAETVSEGSFNGTTALVKDGNVHIYEIVYNAGSALFFQDRGLIHRMSFVDAVGYETVHLSLGAECINTNSNTTNNTLKTRGFACSRIGAPSSRPDFFRINTAISGVIKNSPGTLEKIIISNPGQGNPTMTLYNNSAASGEVIIIIDLTIANGGFVFELDFDTGLAFTTTGSGFEILVTFN